MLNINIKIYHIKLIKVIFIIICYLDNDIIQVQYDENTLPCVIFSSMQCDHAQF